MDVNLNGKVALVTGAGPNIGSGLALMLGKYGAKVACNDIRPEAAQAAVTRLERNGIEAIAIPGDVSDEAQVKAYVQKVVDRWGHIDILINGAAIDGGASVLDFDYDRWTRQIMVNLSGNFLNTKWVGRHMVDNKIKGSIVCLASTAGWQGRANSIGYCSSKGGIIQFVRAAAMDLAPHGIRINTFTPTATQPDNVQMIAARSRAAARGGGWYDLPDGPERANAAGQPGQKYHTGGTADFATMVPLGELPTPTDYGHVVAWLCSDYARLITGSDFNVDGGALAKYWPYVPPAEKAGPLPLIKMDVTEM
ncbi:MAG: SDR family oxidoreductase [SAR202 cluster bacterium]|nr:SDR family oxidoreductase [SAR202 cluster bacterium]